jgi:hypothetical protein
MHDYLPLDDVFHYLLLVVADVLILIFWWKVMSHFPNSDEIGD